MSPLMALRNARLAVLAVAILSLASAHGTARQAAETPPAEGTAAQPGAAETDPVAVAVPDRPAPVPVADIPARAAEVTANVRRIEALVQPQSVVEAIETAMAEQASEVVERRTALTALGQGRASVERVEDQRIEWAQIEAALDRWMRVLQTRWSSLQAERSELRNTRALWTLTRQNAASEEVQPQVLQQIDTVLGELARADSNLGERIDVVAAMIDRVSRRSQTVDDSLARLDTISETARERVFTRDAEPFWHGLALPELAEIRQEWQYWVATLTGFVEERQDRFTVLGGIFVVLLLGAGFVRRWSRTWPDDAALEAARHVVSRPVSAALALTLAASALVIPRSVGPVSDVTALLALVPVYRLGVGLAAPHIRWIMYGVTGLLALHLIGGLAPDDSLLRRSFLLVLTAASVAGGAWLIKRLRRSDVGKSRSARVCLAALHLVTLLLGVALVTNLLGWFTLSQLLFEATVFSSYSAVGWTIVTLAMAAMTAVVPRSPIGRLLPSVVKYESAFRSRALFLIAALAVLFWGRNALVRFRLYDALGQQLESAMSASLSAGGLDLSVGGLLGALVILVVTFPLARFLRFVLSEEILPRFSLPVGVDHTVVAVMNYTLVVVGVLLAAGAAGLDATQLTIVFGALGVGIGFGLQNVVSNFVSGLILMLERPIKVGDRIETSGRLGIVTGIGIRASTLKMFDGSEVVVPNGDLISKEVVNWTLSDESRRIEVLVTVAYGSDVSKVLEILERVASAHPSVLDTPQPSAQLIGFGELALNFRLLAWTHLADSINVLGNLHVTINEELEKAGIQRGLPERLIGARLGLPSSRKSTAGS